MTAGVTTNHVLVPWLRLRGELSDSGSPIAGPTMRGLIELTEIPGTNVLKCPRMSTNVGTRMGYGDSPSGGQAGFTPRQNMTAGVGFPVAVLASLSVVSPEPDRTALGAVGSEVCAGQAAGNRDWADHTKQS